MKFVYKLKYFDLRSWSLATVPSCEYSLVPTSRAEPCGQILLNGATLSSCSVFKRFSLIKPGLTLAVVDRAGDQATLQPQIGKSQKYLNKTL